MIYILLIFLLYFLGFICLRVNNGWQKKQNKQIFLFLFFFACALVIGLRSDSVGVDTKAYHEIFINEVQHPFEYIFSPNNKSSIEKGYLIFMKLCSYFINDYYFFQLIFSLVYCFGMAKFIYNNSSDVFMSSMLFLCSSLLLFFMGIQRQFFAGMLLCNSWYYLKNNRFVPSFVLFLFAVGIHTSAVIFLIFIFIYMFRNNPPMLLLIVGVILICALNIQSILKIVAKIFPKFAGYIDGTSSHLDANMIVVVWAVIGLLALLMFFKAPRSFNIRCEYVFCMLYAIFSFGGLWFNYLDRIGYYFMPFIMILIPNAKNYLPIDLNLKNAFSIAVNLCYVAFFLMSINANPYTFFFSAV